MHYATYEKYNYKVQRFDIILFCSERSGFTYIIYPNMAVGKNEKRRKRWVIWREKLKASPYLTGKEMNIQREGGGGDIH